MSTVESLYPPLRLLERRPQPPTPMRPTGALQAAHESWWERQLEKVWAWGDGARHHRMGSWERRSPGA